MQLDDFDERFATTLEVDDVETIGGLVLNEFGELPGKGEIVFIDGFKFTVFSVAQNRIMKLHLELPSLSEETTEEAQDSLETPAASDH